MSSDAWVLDDFTTLNLQTDGGTDTPIAGIQELTIIPTVSMEQLYTGDSIKIEEQFQHEFEVNVEVGYSLWDPIVARQWLGGSGGTEAGSMTDTTQPQKYTLEGTFDSVGGDRTLGDTDPVSVSGITFPEMPIKDVSRGEYEQYDLSGTGEDISNVDVVDNTV